MVKGKEETKEKASLHRKVPRVSVPAGWEGKGGGVTMYCMCDSGQNASSIIIANDL
jgi:hypothetical protein